MSFISREQRPKTQRNRETKAILGNREHRKSNVDFGEQGNKAIYFRGTSEQAPSPWEGLSA